MTGGGITGFFRIFDFKRDFRLFKVVIYRIKAKNYLKLRHRRKQKLFALKNIFYNRRFLVRF